MSKERSKLFLSCDLVGSTAYKQRNANDRRAIAEDRGESHLPWQQTFLEFYNDFPQIVGEVREVMAADYSLEWLPDFDLWKPIGDELVFTVDVDHEDLIYSAVRIWIRSMKLWADRMKPLGMNTKGAAFVATFPGPDRDVAVPRRAGSSESARSAVADNDDICSASPKHHGDYLFDYFGPSIDTGFRLFARATPRRFPISVEVAWAMLEAAHQHRRSGFWDLADLEYRGGAELKGVWDGRDYPLFTIDRHHDDPVNAATKTMDKSSEMSPENATELCRSCVEDPKWPSGIFLPQSGSDSLKRAPVDPLADLLVDNDMIGSESAPSDMGDGKIPEDAPTD